MPPVTDRSVLLAATVVVGVCLLLSAILLLGFARHRLRAWNIYIVLSFSALAFLRFGEYATGQDAGWGIVAAWANLAVGMVVGLAGVLRLARADPPLWRRDGRR